MRLNGQKILKLELQIECGFLGSHLLLICTSLASVGEYLLSSTHLLRGQHHQIGRKPKFPQGFEKCGDCAPFILQRPELTTRFSSTSEVTGCQYRVLAAAYKYQVFPPFPNQHPPPLFFLLQPLIPPEQPSVSLELYFSRPPATVLLLVPTGLVSMYLLPPSPQSSYCYFYPFSFFK